MTNNTINNVPRELLERAVQIPSKASVEENHAAIVERGRAQAEIRTLLSAPSPAGVYSADPLACPGCASGCFRCASPAGVDGLETICVTQGGCNVSWTATKVLSPAGTALCRLSDAQAIIDGLRGEVAELKQSAQGKLILRLYQHAKRIGELEGLLRSESARVDFLDAYIVTADAPDTGKAAMLADSGTLRECIDAALSAGKEGE